MIYQHPTHRMIRPVQYFWLFLAVLLPLSNAISQTTTSPPSILVSVDKNGQEVNIFSSKNQLNDFIDKELSKYWGKGYLNAKADTFKWKDTLYLEIFAGPLFQVESKVTLREKVILEENGVLDSSFLGSILDPIKRLENSGYPFASLLMDSLVEKSTLTQIFWTLRPGPYTVLDSIVIQSSDPIPINYLLRYLDLRKGQPYNERKLRELSTRIREIPFLEPNGPTEVIFKQKGATVFIKVKKRKANTFNGVLGLRPNEATGEILFTGDADLRIINALNKGEDINLVWKRLQTQTQELILAAKTPFILNRPISLDGMIRIYRRDSTFSQFRGIAGVSFALTGGASIRLFTESNQTNRLSEQVNELNTGNSNLNLYGLGLRKLALDYLYNPARGYFINLEASVGTRQSRNEENQSNQRQNILRTDWQIEYYIPLFDKNTLKLSNIGSTYIGESLFTSELYRIGGLRTIRGFDEESIFANNWTVSSLEYRFLPELNTAIYAFFDHAWYEKKDQVSYVRDLPYSFGIGTNFQTKAGIFTFNYALGQQFDNPLLVRNAKISFGFRNIF